MLHDKRRHHEEKTENKSRFSSRKLDKAHMQQQRPSTAKKQANNSLKKSINKTALSL